MKQCHTDSFILIRIQLYSFNCTDFWQWNLWTSYSSEIIKLKPFNIEVSSPAIHMHACLLEYNAGIYWYCILGYFNLTSLKFGEFSLSPFWWNKLWWNAQEVATYFRNLLWMHCNKLNSMLSLCMSQWHLEWLVG